MSTPQKPTGEPEENMPSHYEKTQLRGRPFIVGAICFFAFAVAMFAAIGMLLQQWSRESWPPRQPPSPPANDARWDTRMPQVQIDPATDLTRLRATEDQRLHALRWDDASHAYAVIPIEDAMKVMADAAAKGQLNTFLPPPQPATPLELQDQKSRETGPPQVPNP